MAEENVLDINLDEEPEQELDGDDNQENEEGQEDDPGSDEPSDEDGNSDENEDDAEYGDESDSEDGEQQQEEDEKSKSPINIIRKQLREKDKALRQAEANERALKKQLESYTAPKPVELPAKPTLESCDFDADEYEKQLTGWMEVKKQADEQQSKQEESARKQQAAFQERVSNYNAGKKALGYSDYDEAESVVMQHLDDTKQKMLLTYVDKPQELVYALGKSIGTLSKLAEIDDYGFFLLELKNIERKASERMSGNKPQTKPERKVTGGSKANSSTDRELKRLYDKAQQSGDYDEYFKLKRSLNKAA